MSDKLMKVAVDAAKELSSLKYCQHMSHIDRIVATARTIQDATGLRELVARIDIEHAARKTAEQAVERLQDALAKYKDTQP